MVGGGWRLNQEEQCAKLSLKVNVPRIVMSNEEEKTFDS